MNGNTIARLEFCSHAFGVFVDFVLPESKMTSNFFFNRDKVFF